MAHAILAIQIDCRTIAFRAYRSPNAHHYHVRLLRHVTSAQRSQTSQRHAISPSQIAQWLVRTILSVVRVGRLARTHHHQSAALHFRRAHNPVLRVAADQDQRRTRATRPSLCHLHLRLSIVFSLNPVPFHVTHVMMWHPQNASSASNLQNADFPRHVKWFKPAHHAS